MENIIVCIKAAELNSAVFFLIEGGFRMNTRYFVLVIGIVLVACTTVGEATQIQATEPTSIPETLAIPTELIETEIPPTPIPTDTQQAVPTEIPFDMSQPIQLEFAWYKNNPVLNKGSSGEWDSRKVMEGKVVLVDEVFHIFYTGTGSDSFGIGYATSSDGFTFTKHEANPIFQTSETGFDSNGASQGTPLFLGEKWMLFYNAVAPGEEFNRNTAGGSSIGLTTAPDPIGPWTSGQQVLKAGGSGEWDSGFIFPNNVILTEDGYRMYYSAGPDPGSNEMSCGMATSPDGLTWTKYDDPGTTEAPFAESDPVMQPGPSAWETLFVQCRVLKTAKGWEMFYGGWNGRSNARTGYAFSIDGVNWIKYKDNPILNKSLISPYAVKVGSAYYLYGYDINSGEFVAATGTIDQP